MFPIRPDETRHDQAWKLNVRLHDGETDIPRLPDLSHFLLPLSFSDLREAVTGAVGGLVSRLLGNPEDPRHLPLQTTKAHAKELPVKLHTLTKRAKRGLNVLREPDPTLRDI